MQQTFTTSSVVKRLSFLLVFIRPIFYFPIVTGSLGHLLCFKSRSWICLDLVLKKCESGHPACYLPIADRAPWGVGCVGFVCKSPPPTAELSLISYT